MSDSDNMDSLPDLTRLSEQEKEALIATLWAEVQRLRARLAAFEAKQQEPVKDAHNSSVPPSRTHKTNVPPGPRTGMHREARVGRAGGGRPLHPDPDHVILAKANSCPHCGHGVQHADQQLQAVYDKIEIPPVKPVSTRVQQYGSQCTYCGQSYVVAASFLGDRFHWP